MVLVLFARTIQENMSLLIVSCWQVFLQKKQAEGIYNNCLPKALKSVFYVQKYEKPEKKNKQVKGDDLKKNTEKMMLSENVQIWLDRLSSLNGLVKDANNRKSILIKQLKE